MLANSYAGDNYIEHGPLKIWGAQEMGMLQGGVFADQNMEFSDAWVDNFGASFTKEAIVNEVIRLSVGVGGVFRFPKPEWTDIKFGGSQAVWFYVGPTIAEGAYVFSGNWEEPIFSMAFGAFPYKYNRDAHNLGEYLFRSTAYPTTVTTGGLMMIGNNGTQLQGLRLSYSNFNFHGDLLVTTETSLPPFYDWSVSLVADYQIAGGLIEVGAGVALKRILPMFADSTTPKMLENAIFTDSQTGRELIGNSAFYEQRATFYKNKIDSIRNGKDVGDTLSLQVMADSLEAIGTLIAGLRSEVSSQGKDKVLDSLNADFFTNQNLSLMFRAAIDFKKLIPSDLFSEEDLRLYAELNVLGWKNYPVLYTDRKNRMPLMFGFNFPAFGILDLLSVQVEWWDNPYLNNHLNLGDGNIPQPYFNSYYSYAEDGEYMGVTKNDNLYWSILAKKEFLPGIVFSAQVGRDHLRVSSPGYFYGSREDPNEVFVRGDDWYWSFQLAWGL